MFTNIAVQKLRFKHAFDIFLHERLSRSPRNKLNKDNYERILIVKDNHAADQPN